MSFSPGLVFFGNIFPLNASYSVTSEDSEYPATELESNDPKHFCRAGSNGDQYITIDMGSGQAVKGAALFNVNLSSGDTFKFQASADNFVSTAQDEVMTLKEREIEIEGTTTRDKTIFVSGLEWSAYQYLRYYLSISGNKVECAVPYIFKGQYEFGKNYQWGYSGGQCPVFIDTPAGRGMVHSELDYTRWEAKISFKGISDAQIQEINRKIALNAYVVFLPEGIAGDIYLGRFTFDFPGHEYFNRWNVGGKFIELPSYR